MSKQTWEIRAGKFSSTRKFPSLTPARQAFHISKNVCKKRANTAFVEYIDDKILQAAHEGEKQIYLGINDDYTNHMTSNAIQLLKSKGYRVIDHIDHQTGNKAWSVYFFDW